MNALLGGLVTFVFVVRQALTYWLTRSSRAENREETVASGWLVSAMWLLYLALLALAARRLAAPSMHLCQVLGFLCVCGGTALRLVALTAIRRFYAPGIVLYRCQRLVDVGPYSVLRHPLTLGLTVEAFGLALISGTGTSLFLGLWVVIVFYNIREEAALLRWFGDPYLYILTHRWDFSDTVIPAQIRVLLLQRPASVRRAEQLVLRSTRWRRGAGSFPTSSAAGQLNGLSHTRTRSIS